MLENSVSAVKCFSYRCGLTALCNGKSVRETKKVQAGYSGWRRVAGVIM